MGSYIGGVLWARLNTTLTPTVVKLHNKHHINPKQSYVNAANHLSAYDIIALYGWV